MRRAALRGSLAALAALLLAAPAAGAQARTGAFWFQVGAGPAWLQMDCGRCESLPDSIPYAGGAGAQVRIGAGTSWTPRLRIGFGADAAFRRRGDRDVTLATLATLVQFHPSERGPLFVRGGIGWGVSTFAGGGTLAEVDGLGLHGEIGADVTRWGRWTVAPYLGALLGVHGRETLTASQQGSVPLDAPRAPRAVYLGLGATWQ